jgi:6,7-dimethyl-8-ribityllumazine synthase
VKAHRRAIAKAGVTISATTIGVTPQDLVVELKSGKSIADVAAEHSVAVQSVVTALDNAANARVNQAVSDHKLSSSEGDRIEVALPKYLAKAVNRTF